MTPNQQQTGSEDGNKARSESRQLNTNMNPPTRERGTSERTALSTVTSPTHNRIDKKDNSCNSCRKLRLAIEPSLQNTNIVKETECDAILHELINHMETTLKNFHINNTEHSLTHWEKAYININLRFLSCYPEDVAPKV